MDREAARSDPRDGVPEKQLSLRSQDHAAAKPVDTRCSQTRMAALAAVVATLATACDREERPQAPYVPLAELEKVYGPIITAGNHPTPDQSGTGDRLGLFLDAQGTLWGLPVIIASDGQVLGCAPAGLHDATITDTYNCQRYDHWCNQ